MSAGKLPDRQKTYVCYSFRVKERREHKGLGKGREVEIIPLSPNRDGNIKNTSAEFQIAIQLPSSY